MLTKEQIKNMKSQLIRHIEASFPEDKKEFAISQIEAMDSEELEKFLIKNQLLKKEDANTGTGHCVFCSIVFGDIKSYKITENSKAIAVLEINPISRGHTIIIPKEHISSEKELPKQVAALSKKVSSLIKKRLKLEEIKTEYSNVLGHEVINIVPFYKNQKGSSERKPASAEELSEMQEILTKKSSGKRVEIRKIIEKIEEKIWLPKRIP
jgi:histidine triad (HIT) family protein